MTRVTDQIKAARQALGMSQTALAMAAGVSEATVRRAETGRHFPSLPHLEAMANALGCRVALVTHGRRENHVSLVTDNYLNGQAAPGHHTGDWHRPARTEASKHVSAPEAPSLHEPAEVGHA